MITYLRTLPVAKQVLWCYLLWYLVMVGRYFDAHLGIWLTSLGISAVIGVGLILSVLKPGAPRPDFWTVARLFIMPFCVSSFSALIKGQGFVLMFSPRLLENLLAASVCALFCLLCWLLRQVPYRATVDQR